MTLRIALLALALTIVNAIVTATLTVIVISGRAPQGVAGPVAPEKPSVVKKELIQYPAIPEPHYGWRIRRYITPEWYIPPGKGGEGEK